MSTSKPSSIVPQPPGKSASAWLSFTKISLRVKKYLQAMSLGSSWMKVLGACSNGSSMLTPKLRSRPAPSCAARMIPSPAPVITMYPCSTIARANATACAYAGSLSRVRAEPKTVTLRISW